MEQAGQISETDVKPGDYVKTPDGEGRVRAVSPPYVKVVMDRYVWKDTRRTKVMVYKTGEVKKW